MAKLYFEIDLEKLGTFLKNESLTKKGKLKYEIDSEQIGERVKELSLTAASAAVDAALFAGKKVEEAEGVYRDISESVANAIVNAFTESAEETPGAETEAAAGEADSSEGPAAEAEAGGEKPESVITVDEEGIASVQENGTEA